MLPTQVTETDDLQKTKKALDEENKRLRREVQLNEQSVKEYAKQGFRQSKEIKELQTKVKSLERSLSASVRDFEKEKAGLLQTDKKRIEEAELDSAGLRQLVRLKTKELSHMKRLASVILQKRNEVRGDASYHLIITSLLAVDAQNTGSEVCGDSRRFAETRRYSPEVARCARDAALVGACTCMRHPPS